MIMKMPLEQITITSFGNDELEERIKDNVDNRQMTLLSKGVGNNGSRKIYWAKLKLKGNADD